MKELFVPYKMAKLAKKKGFQERCLAWYGKRKRTDRSSNFVLERGGYNSLKDSSGRVDAPIYSQLIDWFREKHMIAIILIPFSVQNNGRKNKTLYSVIISSTGYLYADINLDETDFDVITLPYQEALSESLEKAFKLI